MRYCGGWESGRMLVTPSGSTHRHLDRQGAHGGRHGDCPVLHRGLRRRGRRSLLRFFRRNQLVQALVVGVLANLLHRGGRAPLNGSIWLRGLLLGSGLLSSRGVLARPASSPLRRGLLGRGYRLRGVLARSASSPLRGRLRQTFGGGCISFPICSRAGAFLGFAAGFLAAGFLAAGFLAGLALTFVALAFWAAAREPRVEAGMDPRDSAVVPPRNFSVQEKRIA